MSTAPDTVVLIHGLWMSSRSWEHWAARYRAAGYRVIDDDWPGMDADVEALRLGPAPIARLSVRAVVDYYERIILGLDRPPIIIGHSFGGAFTQVLLDRGLGAAGVAVDTAAVKGVLRLPFSTLRTGWPILRNPLNRNRAVAIGLKQFHYRFTNHLSLDESRPAFERYCVPATGRILFEGAGANFNPKGATKVDFRNDRRAPLLFIAGGIDHVSPPSLVRANAKKFHRSHAAIGYKEFAGRSHFIVGQDGWEEVADYALNWAVEHAGVHAAATDGGSGARWPKPMAS
jgi:pimeloyl-ACP methyl ester carboxylesterase